MYNRITYIDALRGFAMLLVVTSHIFTFSFAQHNALSEALCTNLQLPLFFFISGYCIYKAFDGVTPRYVLTSLVKKVPMMLVAPVLLLALYCWVMRSDFIGLIQGSAKDGYWFTITLFEFIAAYSFWCCCSSVVNLTHRIGGVKI